MNFTETTEIPQQEEQPVQREMRRNVSVDFERSADSERTFTFPFSKIGRAHV